MKRPLAPARNPRSWVLAGLSLWLILVFGHYFPFPAALDLSFLGSLRNGLSQGHWDKFLGNSLNFLWVLFVSLGVVLVLARLGNLLRQGLGLGVKDGFLRFALEMALGIVGLDLLWLGLGFNGLWWRTLVRILAALFLLAALGDLARSVKVERPHLRAPRGWDLALGLSGLLALGLALMQGMVPDVFFDALVYHLSALEFWHDHHGITDYYTNLYSYYPFGAELYFLNGFLLAGSEAAKLLNAFSAGFCALLAAGWAREEAGEEAGPLAWAMVLALPLISASVWTTQNEVVLAFFMLALFYSYSRWRRSLSVGWAVMAGLMAGAALSVKYTAVPGLALGWVIGRWAYPAPYSLNRRRQELLLAATALLIGGGWYLRNWVYTGNPFYPYLSTFLGWRNLPVDLLSALMGDHQAVDWEHFSLLAWGRQVLTRDLDKTIAPLLFGSLPFLVLQRPLKSAVRFLLAASLAWSIVGLLISHQSRLLIPVFVAAACALAMGLGGEKARGRDLWRAAVLVFAFLGLLSLARLSIHFYHSERIWMGAQTREEYLAASQQTRTYYTLVQTARVLLPPTQHILLVGDARSLYFVQPFMANSVFDEQALWKLAKTTKTGDQIYKRLREMGVDAIAISAEEGRRLAGQGHYFVLGRNSSCRLDEFTQIWTDPLYIDGNHGLYRLRSTPAVGRERVPNLFALYQAIH